MFGSKWFVVEEEKVLLRGLTFLEYQELTSKSYNTSMLYAYDIAYNGIVDVIAYDDSGRRVKYDRDVHFQSIFEFEFSFVERCVEIILHKLTVLSEEERKQIQGVMVFQIETAIRPEIVTAWSCERCVERKLCAARKCSLLSENDIELVMKHDYKPPQVFPGLAESDRWPKQTQAEAETDATEQMHNSAESQRKQRRAGGIKARLEKQKAAKSKKVAEEMTDSYESGTTVSKEEVVFRSPHFLYERCPVSYASSELRPMLAVASRSLGAEEMLVAGGLAQQPMKFVEIRSAVQYYQQDTLDKQRKIDEDKHKAESKRERSRKK